MDKTKIENFQRTKDFLLCVDSDGCAMNTMEIKHRRSFGPKIIEVWGLEADQERILDMWNHLNLYASTRGINRFKGLAALFEKLDAEGIAQIPGWRDLKEWADTTPALSNAALKAEIEKTGKEILKQAYDWSLRVNESIAQIPMEDGGPFENVKETLAMAGEKANISIVSSANGQAIQDEWGHFGLAEYTDAMLGQEAGTKSICIEGLKAKGGYADDHILMTGDALGDLKAAEDNGVLFYPIIAGQEGKSWKRLHDEAFSRFLAGTYAGEYQKSLLDEFKSLLSD